MYFLGKNIISVPGNFIINNNPLIKNAHSFHTLYINPIYEPNNRSMIDYGQYNNIIDIDGKNAMVIINNDNGETYLTQLFEKSKFADNIPVNYSQYNGDKVLAAKIINQTNENQLVLFYQSGNIVFFDIFNNMAKESSQIGCPQKMKNITKIQSPGNATISIFKNKIITYDNTLNSLCELEGKENFNKLKSTWYDFSLLQKELNLENKLGNPQIAFLAKRRGITFNQYSNNNFFKIVFLTLRRDYNQLPNNHQKMYNESQQLLKPEVNIDDIILQNDDNKKEKAKSSCCTVF